MRDRQEDKNDSSINALALSRQARKLWLQSATSLEDLDRVEDLYRRALNSKRKVAGKHAAEAATGGKKRKRSSDGKKMVAALSPEEYRKAGERLSLLYIQSGRPYKATMGLKYLGFECRLSERILNYPLKLPEIKNTERNTTGKKNGRDSSNVKSMPEPPCCVVDDFLSQSELNHLRKVFGDVSSSYWSSHNYIIDEEPPAPYFSYVIDLRQPGTQTSGAKKGFLRSVIDKILTCGPVSEKFQHLRRDARYVELWAHNRPHASGHQLHFDSDDEGRSRQQEFPKHPIASTVLNLSSHSRVGGPTLVTIQRLRNPTTTNLSSVKGWLVPSKPARLVCFDGSVLHGVIPGKGTIPPPMTATDDNHGEDDRDGSGSRSYPPREHRPRRVTLMMAFWKHIKVRKGSKPGSARPWPKKTVSCADVAAAPQTPSDLSSTLPSWAVELDRTDIAVSAISSSKRRKDETSRKVIPVPRVYERFDGNPVPKYHIGSDDSMGDGYYMPEYDRVFQGF